jgi:hypothetical protein
MNSKRRWRANAYPSPTSRRCPSKDAALERLAAGLGFAPAATGRLLAAARPVASHVEMLRGVWIRRLDASTR